MIEAIGMRRPGAMIIHTNQPKLFSMRFDLPM
jgi:hypothetical protein